MVSLESSRLFHDLPPEEMARLKRVAVERTYSGGERIFEAGDQGDGLYVVLSGSVKIAAAALHDEGRALSTLQEGEIFGEMAVLENTPRSASAHADGPTVLAFIPREEMLSLLENVPGLSARLVREISARLREFTRHYINETLQAERLSLVGRFARSIIHDLKNPLNIIGISAEMATMEKSTPEGRLTAKTRIRKQVERITNMVNELLEFTRDSQAHTVLPAADYSQFITQVVDELRPEIEMRGVQIELENPAPQVLVPLNPQRLSRVFHNLMHNGTDAMPEGGRIKLRFHVTDQEVTTELEDTGTGIPPEMAGKLFQAFATHGKAHGTGLGLSICKKIIEDHRGSIHARSAPGRGAIFVFQLPRANNPDGPGR